MSSPFAAPLTHLVVGETHSVGSTARTSYAIGVVAEDGKVSGVTYIPNATITGRDTHTRTIGLVNKGADGSGSTFTGAVTNTPDTGTLSVYSFAWGFTVGDTDLPVDTITLTIVGNLEGQAPTIVGIATDVGDGPDSVVWLDSPGSAELSGEGEQVILIAPVTLSADTSYFLVGLADGESGGTSIVPVVTDPPVLSGDLSAVSNTAYTAASTDPDVTWDTDTLDGDFAIPFALSGTTSLASLDFTEGHNAAAFDETPLTLSSTAADLDVAAGDVLAFATAALVGGNGLSDPGGHVRVTIVRR